MRIDSIELQNYRCFEKIILDFDPQFTLIVGNNGAGKSTVLDALAVGLGSFFLGLDGISSIQILRQDARMKMFPLGSRIERQPQYPSSVICRGEVVGQNIEWKRKRNGDRGKTTYGNAYSISNIAKQLSAKIHNGDPNIILPVISYYGTGRLWAQKKEKRVQTQNSLTTRTAGYIDCLGSMSNDKLMYKWFEKMTYQSLQENEPIPELQVVQKALIACFNGKSNNGNLGVATNCSFNVKSGEMEVTYVTKDGRKEKHPIREMSDGYRNMLSMVGDIAYRMAMLNPQLLDRVIEDTPGVVLIDEIDLHLHPSWQQHIVADLMSIFPKLQFIATTHAPNVISSVQNNKILILDQNNVYRIDEPTYGKDANSVLRSVMDVPERQIEIQEEFKNFYIAIDKQEYQKAKQILESLTIVLGDNDSEITSADATLRLETME